MSYKLISMSILYLFISHYVADFIFQSPTMAEKKGKSVQWLLMHVIVYALVVGALTVPLFSTAKAFTSWIAINFCLHLGTDYITSRLSGHFYSKKDMKMFWNVIGIDQAVHYLTLYYTYHYING